MATVVDMQTNFKALEFGPIVFGIFKRNLHQITTLIRAQMWKGKRGDGSQISPKYRSVRYARAKAKRNPLPGPRVPDLYFLGGFYRAMKTTLRVAELETTSSDEKADHLLSKYGGAPNTLFVVSKESEAAYNQTVFMPDFATEIKRATGLAVELK